MVLGPVRERVPLSQSAFRKLDASGGSVGLLQRSKEEFRGGERVREEGGFYTRKIGDSKPFGVIGFLSIRAWRERQDVISG